MKKVYGYIRVSTVKQGTGVSLQEQKEAIIRYADKHQLNVIQWFEEQETAAKQGRPLFTKMMKHLRTGKAEGVIIHKIDRSARNLKDWATLGDLIDEGIDVHFAHESLDMDTRGGRLAADIQAVIASDYIRNLRDEAIKGIYGRLKQGVYPFRAPPGYNNNGRGNMKTIDPIQGPLVRKAFQLYSSEKYSLDKLTKTMTKLGLRNLNGKVMSITTLSKILKNPFYAGVLNVKGKSFQGGHDPLISSELYTKVQNILKGKTNSRIIKHDFLFRKIIKCADCGYSLIGEKKKGHIYYRCHTRNCPTKCIRQELIEMVLLQKIEEIQLHDIEAQVLNDLLNDVQKDWAGNQTSVEESLNLQQGQISQKLERLTDAYIENSIDKTLFENRKEKLLIELRGLRYKSNDLLIQKDVVFRKAKNFLELLKSVKKSYLTGITEERRKMIKYVTSNLTLRVKNPIITMRSPFYEIANHANFSSSELNRYTPRTFVADLAIDPVTKQVDFSNCVPILPHLEDTPQLRESMQQLLDMILGFFEEEERKVESGELKEEEQLLDPYVQEIDPSTQSNTRSLPEAFNRRRA